MIDFYLLETHDGASITRIYPRVPGFTVEALSKVTIRP